MKNRPDALRQIRAIDDLVSSSPQRLFSLSPNDALVQISLPLVLILAIMTRLIVVGQSMTEQQESPAILEMWKQQLIFRIDQEMDAWSSDAQLPAFPDASRILWEGSYPADPRFQLLCEKTQALNDPENLQRIIYEQALIPQDSSETASLRLYDPLSSQASTQPTAERPPESIITPERRNYALAHIADRILQWRQHVEALQWATIDETAMRLPLSDQSEQAEASAEFRRISSELSQRGYPFLDQVTQEYEVTP
ncbi:hypothetical protein P3T73_13510 [Kiritimatiellota bacterium B12222]|nr:hypothetical protein P3T73_13510 [Kiritimatiellota bacterium B12222]